MRVSGILVLSAFLASCASEPPDWLMQPNPALQQYNQQNGYLFNQQPRYDNRCMQDCLSLGYKRELCQNNCKY